ncbi:MAG: phosphatidylserine decarboxylase [Gammaproteobacteria bacterium]|nr:phosphatidylserine decarboxylase [Gammaproteobacteria bacterium]
MARSRYPLIARQAWLPIAVTFAVAGLIWYFLALLWALPLLVLAALIAWLFRDPYRQIPSTPLGVVSPADGLVESVDTVHDPFLQRDAVRIVLAMRGGDVYTTRSPVEGKVMDMLQAAGEGEGEAATHGVWIKTDEGDDIVIVMGRGRLGNPPRCFVQCGERVGQGQRCGFINFGSRLEVYLPANSRIEIRPGSHIHAGADLLGVLVHKTDRAIS